MGNGVAAFQVLPPQRPPFAPLRPVYQLTQPPSGIMVVYTLRVNISVAAQDMRDDLHWSEAQKGLVLVSALLPAALLPRPDGLFSLSVQSAFYWGYALGQIPAARFVQTYGAKWIFGFRYAAPSFVRLLAPVFCLFPWPLLCLFGVFLLWVCFSWWTLLGRVREDLGAAPCLRCHAVTKSVHIPSTSTPRSPFHPPFQPNDSIHRLTPCCSVLIPSALTLLVPAACKQSFGLALFVRAIIGFFESASFPAVFHFFPIWIPLKGKRCLSVCSRVPVARLLPVFTGYLCEASCCVWNHFQVLNAV